MAISRIGSSRIGSSRIGSSRIGSSRIGSSRIGIVVGAVGICAVSLIGCGSDDVFDPSGSAEIGIRDQIELELDLDSEVTCTEPPTADVGVTFECVATDEEGKSYTFVAEILPDEVIGTRLD